MNDLEDGFVNRMSNIPAFIYLWDHKIENVKFHERVVKRPAQVETAQTGNINIGGKPYTAAAEALTRQNEAFWEFVEPGVRHLVKQVVNKHCLITYSSCEGHVYKNGLSGDERHVGILPRNDKERRAIRLVVERICQAVSEAGGSGVTFEVDETLVHDEQKSYPCIDLIFCKSEELSWCEYSNKIQNIYTSVISEFEKIPPIADVPIKIVSTNNI